MKLLSQLWKLPRLRIIIFLAYPRENWNPSNSEWNVEISRYYSLGRLLTKETAWRIAIAEVLPCSANAMATASSSTFPSTRRTRRRVTGAARSSTEGLMGQFSRSRKLCVTNRVTPRKPLTRTIYRINPALILIVVSALDPPNNFLLQELQTLRRSRQFSITPRPPLILSSLKSPRQANFLQLQVTDLL